MNPDDAQSCSVCLHKLGRPKTASGESFKRKVEFYGRTEPMIPKTKTMAPVGAGAILVINALLSMGGLWMTNIYVSNFLPDVSEAMTVPNLVFGGLAIFVLCGGVLAMLRRMWGLTLIACIASFPLVIVFGLFCAILEVMLSIAALVILAQSRDEFVSKSRRRH
jgi:lysylphosphatidylglycerol synthetase-like protein (DUF2156 family)